MALIKAEDKSKVAADKAAINTAPAAVKPQFEAEPDGEVAVSEKVDKPVSEKTIAVISAASTAVALPLPTRSTKLQPVLDTLKNALRVDYNTLTPLQVNQGNYLLKDSNKASIGDVIDFDLLSYQDNYVISPGAEGAEALEFVRYSDDGITTTQGENVAQYLQQLQAEGYSKAACKPRCVLVIDLLGSAKVPAGMELYGKLYQIDLAPSSKTKFDAYRHQTSYDVGKGKRTPEQAACIRSTVNTVTKGSKDWSVADFTYAPG